MAAWSRPFGRILFGTRPPSEHHASAAVPAVVAKASTIAPLFDWRVITLLVGLALTVSWAALWVWLGLRLVTALV